MVPDLTGTGASGDLFGLFCWSGAVVPDLVEIVAGSSGLPNLFSGSDALVVAFWKVRRESSDDAVVGV